MSPLKVVGFTLFRTLPYEYFTLKSSLLNMDYVYSHPSKLRRRWFWDRRRQQTTYVETDFPMNAMLKWGGWLQTIYFDQEKKRYSYLRKFTGNEMSKMTIQGGGGPSWSVGGSSGSSSPMSNNTGGDARVPEDDVNKSSTEVCRDKELFFSFRISQQVSNLIIPCLVLAAGCSFESVSSNTLKPVSLSPSPSVNLETVMVLSSGSSFSASSRALCFRMSVI